MAGPLIGLAARKVISLLGRSAKNLKADKKLRKEFLKNKQGFEDNLFKLYKRKRQGQKEVKTRKGFKVDMETAIQFTKGEAKKADSYAKALQKGISRRQKHLRKMKKTHEAGGVKQKSLAERFPDKEMFQLKKGEMMLIRGSKKNPKGSKRKPDDIPF